MWYQLKHVLYLNTIFVYIHLMLIWALLLWHLLSPQDQVHFLRAVLGIHLGKDELTNGCILMAVKYDPCGRQEESQRESGQLLSQIFFFLCHKPPKALNGFCSPLIKLKTQ